MIHTIYHVNGMPSAIYESMLPKAEEKHVQFHAIV